MQAGGTAVTRPAFLLQAGQGLMGESPYSSLLVWGPEGQHSAHLLWKKHSECQSFKGSDKGTFPPFVVGLPCGKGPQSSWCIYLKRIKAAVGFIIQSTSSGKGPELHGVGPGVQGFSSLGRSGKTSEPTSRPEESVTEPGGRGGEPLGGGREEPATGQTTGQTQLRLPLCPGLRRRRGGKWRCLI